MHTVSIFLPAAYLLQKGQGTFPVDHQGSKLTVPVMERNDIAYHLCDTLVKATTSSM